MAPNWDIMPAQGKRCDAIWSEVDICLLVNYVYLG